MPSDIEIAQQAVMKGPADRVGSIHAIDAEFVRRALRTPVVDDRIGGAGDAPLGRALHPLLTLTSRHDPVPSVLLVPATL